MEVVTVANSEGCCEDPMGSSVEKSVISTSPTHLVNATGQGPDDSR